MSGWRKALVIAAAFLLFAVLVSQIQPVRDAVAQAESQLLTLLPTDHIAVRRSTSAYSNYVTPAQITSQSGYAKYTPGTGFVYTFGNSQTYMAISPSGTLAWGYFYLAANPSDGARNCIFTTQILTGATVYANVGQSINGAVTSFTANSGACYLYGLSNTTWDRD